MVVVVVLLRDGHWHTPKEWRLRRDGRPILLCQVLMAAQRLHSASTSRSKDVLSTMGSTSLLEPEDSICDGDFELWEAQL